MTLIVLEEHIVMLIVIIILIVEVCSFFLCAKAIFPSLEVKGRCKSALIAVQSRMVSKYEGCLVINHMV